MHTPPTTTLNTTCSSSAFQLVVLLAISDRRHHHTHNLLIIGDLLSSETRNLAHSSPSSFYPNAHHCLLRCPAGPVGRRRHALIALIPGLPLLPTLRLLLSHFSARTTLPPITSPITTGAQHTPTYTHTDTLPPTPPPLCYMLLPTSVSNVHPHRRRAWAGGPKTLHAMHPSSFHLFSIRFATVLLTRPSIPSSSLP